MRGDIGDRSEGVDPLESTYERALDQALRYLGYRARSIDETRARLARSGHDEGVIDAVITRLLELGYLDDEAFALALARDLLNSPRPRGERAVLARLRKSGVDDLTSRRALESALEESEESPRDRVLRAAERWCRRLRPGEDRARARRRLWGHLLRAGFDSDLTREAVDILLPRSE